MAVQCTRNIFTSSLQTFVVIRYSANYQKALRMINTANFLSRRYITRNVKQCSPRANFVKITSIEYEKFQNKGILQKLKSRKVSSANILDFISSKVTMLGWIERCNENHKVFIVDGYGKTLCNIPAENYELNNLIKTLGNVDIVSVSGLITLHSTRGSHPALLIEDISLLNQSDCSDRTGNPNLFTFRSHTCGDLRSEHSGQSVNLCGWLQYQRMSKFLLLRDSYGLVQCILPENTDISKIPTESVLKVDGIVALRPPNMINHSMATGDIEVIINSFEILNLVENIPFTLRQHQKPKEQLRLQHRYVDLRFPEMQNNLRLRSQMLHRMRCFLIEQHSFVEVETPTLFCRTPGGAREFVVPTRHKGLFYSLVQSPQQFKQMLMVGGVDRYFQVARCYRDETTRPDRQPEFTQLDIETSFANVDDVLNLIEQLLYQTYPVPISKPPFRRITYRKALETYGSDKPDVSYGLELHNITSCIENVGNEIDFASYAIVLPSALGKFTKKIKESVKDFKKKYLDVHNLDYHKLSEDVRKKLFAMLDLDDCNTLFIATGPNENVCWFLGEIRTLLAEEMKSKGLIGFDKDVCEPLWIVDFPLFVKGKNGELETCHHPFTAPHPSDIHLLESEPLNVRGLAYDLVINGNEVGGGSVRVHNADLQVKLLSMLQIDPGSMEHFMKALRSGCPPHAGIALGIDRMMAQACGAESIRDVIAFPKSHEGKDPLSGAPNVITDDDKIYYHLNSL